MGPEAFRFAFKQSGDISFPFMKFHYFKTGICLEETKIMQLHGFGALKAGMTEGNKANGIHCWDSYWHIPQERA
jgi:hypothetical protein